MRALVGMDHQIYGVDSRPNLETPVFDPTKRIHGFCGNFSSTPYCSSDPIHSLMQEKIDIVEAVKATKTAVSVDELITITADWRSMSWRERIGDNQPSRGNS